ncbi:hypothetical protein GCM10009096_33400 [Parasphingorhabdus litoris]|uniref:Secreted protein n=1 Tax=Parasphingorhabdus litoris TaxID=394733 RepID=A0ABP3KVD7_9SPHN|nr:hypothetical protein [Parasphingorhabdus litoris]
MKILIRTAAIASISALAISTPSAFAGETATVEDVAKKEKPKKITDRKHPDYVRCRSEPIMGSLARKRRVCMTNREWVAHNLEGSKRSREFVDDNQPSFAPGNN